MEQNTSIMYKALNVDSYNSLAAYAITTPTTVTLFPEHLTIVISESASNEIGEFIDGEGLDFHITPVEIDDDTQAIIDNPTADAATLRTVIQRMFNDRDEMAVDHHTVISEITKRLDSSAKDAEKYSRWFNESLRRENRVKRQVQAIAVLINSIYPAD